MVKVTIDWGDNAPKLDVFKCNYPVGRAIFTLLNNMPSYVANFEEIEKPKIDEN